MRPASTDTKRLYGFGVAWFDMDDDGQLDLLVANDSGPNYVYRNLGNGKFEDVSYPSGAALDGNGREQAHMGVAIGDYDNDGRDDIHITNFADDFNVLYRNHDGTSFNDVSFSTGLAQVVDPVPRLGHRLSRLRQRRLERSARRQRPRLSNGRSASTGTRPTPSARCCSAISRGKRFEEVGAAAGTALDDTASRAGIGGRRFRQRRRHRLRRQHDRRSAAAGEE